MSYENLKYKIISDSSSNIFSVEGIDFSSVPLHIIVGEQDFVDDENVDLDEMQNALASYKGKTSTSCPSAESWLEAFGDADIVFCVTITSNLSGAYSSANTAKQIYEEEHEGKKVYLFDSLSTGPEMVLVIEKIKEMVLLGVEPDTIAEKINEYMQHTHLYYSLASVDNLAKNGRINPILAKGLGLLGIRIVGKASDEGKLEPMDKCRGDKKAFPCIIKHMKNEGYSGGKVIISHTNTEEGADELKKLIEKEFGSFNGVIQKNTALCSYYAEPKSLIIGFEGV